MTAGTKTGPRPSKSKQSDTRKNELLPKEAPTGTDPQTNVALDIHRMTGASNRDSNEEKLDTPNIAGSSETPTIDHQNLSIKIQKVMPRKLAKFENLLNHITRKYEPIVEYKKQLSDKKIELSGSLAELLFLDNVVRTDTKQLLQQSDIDMLEMNPETVHTAKESTSTGLVLDTAGCSRGYTRIKRVPSGTYVTAGMTLLNQPSEETPFAYFYHEDRVPCYRCSGWDESVDGLLRRQTSSWPTPQLLHELKSTSVLLVHKVDPAAYHENSREYFRFSFSLVEKVLSKSLPHCFRYIYLFVKLLLKFYCPTTVLKTYAIKTAFYHFLTENYSDQHRFSETPSLGVLMFVDKLRRTFVEGTLQNFFVSEINLLEWTQKHERLQVVQILGGILSQAEVKISELHSSVSILDYRSRDRALEAADKARSIMAETLRNHEIVEAEHLHRAIALLEKRYQCAPDVRLVGLTLLHAYILCKEHKKADTLRNKLQKIDSENKRLEVLKLESQHAPLFSTAVADALTLAPQAVYLESVLYEFYVDHLFKLSASPTNSKTDCQSSELSLADGFLGDVTQHVTLEQLFSHYESSYERLPSSERANRLSYDLCKSAIFFDISENCDVHWKSRARHIYDECKQSFDGSSTSKFTSDDISCQLDESQVRPAISLTTLVRVLFSLMKLSNILTYGKHVLCVCDFGVALTSLVCLGFLVTVNAINANTSSRASTYINKHTSTNTNSHKHRHHQNHKHRHKNHNQHSRRRIHHSVSCNTS